MPDHGVSARFGGYSSHRPPGNKVALGETVRRMLSASSTPHIVFGAGDARRKFARRASRWTRAAWVLFVASLAAWPSRQPGARCFSSSLTPPQDSENCHTGGNAFVLFDGIEPMTLFNLGLQKSSEVFISLARRAFCLFIRGFVPRVCEALFVGVRQRTRGCSPRGLGGVGTLIQGL